MQNEMRDRLVELTGNQFAELYKDGDWNFNEMLVGVADHLIKNGVIVPPCKVGDSVYVPFDDKTIQELETVVLTIESDGLFLNAVCKCDFENCDNVCDDGKVCGMHFEYKEIGKTVFLTREEAEQKLKEGAKE